MVRINFLELSLILLLLVALDACKKEEKYESASFLKKDDTIKNQNPESNLKEIPDSFQVQIANWFNGYKSAVSFTFDDSNPAHEKIAEVLEESDFKGSFYVSPGKGDWIVLRNIYKKMAEKGHEIGNHSWNHVKFNNIPVDSIIEEIVKPISFIYEKTGFKPISFVQPHNWTNRVIDSIILSHKIFCRNSSFYSMDNSVKKSIISSTIIADVIPYLNKSINENKWLIIAGHGMDGIGWEPVTSDFLRKLCKNIKGFDSIWIGTFSEIAAYDYLKNELNIKGIISGNDLEIKINNFDSLKYTDIEKLPLTVQILNRKDVLSIEPDSANPNINVSFLKAQNLYYISFDLKKLQSVKLKIKYTISTGIRTIGL